MPRSEQTKRPARGGRCSSICWRCPIRWRCPLFALEGIISQRRHDDVVARRDWTGHAVEGLAPQVLVLKSRCHSAIVTLVEVLPESDSDFVHLFVHSGAGGDPPRERRSRHDSAPGIAKSWNAKSGEACGRVEEIRVGS